MEFSFELLIIVAVIFFFAAFIHGSTGFGFPMVATPLLALFTDIQTAIILTLIPTLLVNTVSIACEGKILHGLRRHFGLALCAMLGSAMGTQILIVTDSEIFKLILAIAIIVYLLSEKINLNLSWVRTYPAASRMIFGLSAGILGGLTNVMAPVLIIFALESRLSKCDTIKASNLCFMLGKLTQIMLFSINSQFSETELSIASAMLIIVAIALYSGIQIKKKIKNENFTKLLKALLLVLAAMLLTQVLVKGQV